MLHLSKGGEKKKNFFPSVLFVYIWILQKQLVRAVFVYYSSPSASFLAAQGALEDFH